MRRRSTLILITILLIATSGCEWLERVSVTSAGSEVRGASIRPSLSADGRYVTFESTSDGLVPGDTNGRSDIFWRDNGTGAIERISVATGGAQATGGDSISASLSSNGRYVAFTSSATSLVPGDTNRASDIFLRDRLRGTTRRVSVSSSGVQANQSSFEPDVSDDGRVAFTSGATNLVPGDRNLTPDVFLTTATGIQRISVSNAGVEGNAPSFSPTVTNDGGYVAFTSGSTNLSTGDTNRLDDVYLHDAVSRWTTRVSVTATGGQGRGHSRSPAISGDGRYVTFQSNAADLITNDTNGATDVFRKDLFTAKLIRLAYGHTGLGQSNGSSGTPAISDDGQIISFETEATNLVPGDGNGTADVVTWIGTTASNNASVVRASTNQAGTVDANGASWAPAMSGNGRYVAFTTLASNLIEGDTNAAQDVMVRFALAASPLQIGYDSGAVPRGGSATVVLVAPWSDNPPSVLIDPGDGLAVTRVQRLDIHPGIVLVTVTADPAATPGRRTIQLRNPGAWWDLDAGGTGVCTGCLTVT